MLAAATGVTDGKLDTQSLTYVPRFISAASAGARPWSTARSSISGLSASITARTSFLRATAPLPQDPEAPVLPACLAAASREEQHERGQRQVAQCRHGDREGGDAQGHRVRVGVDQRGRAAGEPAART